MLYMAVAAVGAAAAAVAAVGAANSITSDTLKRDAGTAWYWPAPALAPVLAPVPVPVPAPVPAPALAASSQTNFSIAASSPLRHAHEPMIKSVREKSVMGA